MMYSHFDDVLHRTVSNENLENERGTLLKLQSSGIFLWVLKPYSTKKFS
jgi:hypothetical protein